MTSLKSSKDPKDLNVLKQNAIKYYQENGVPIKMEEILNSMFYEDPPDVYGYLVNFFGQFTKTPTLSKLHAIQVVDACGMPTVQTDAICTVNNKDKLLSTTTIPSPNIKARPEDREKIELELCDSVAAAVKLINTCFSDQLSGLDPRNQAEIDTIVLSKIEKLKEESLLEKAQEKEEEEIPIAPVAVVEEKDKKKSGKDKKETTKPIEEDKLSAKLEKKSEVTFAAPDQNVEVFVAGSEAVCAISQAICSCAAAAQSLPLYRHISNIGRSKGAINEFRIPLPMVTIIQSGKSGLGKLNCIKEYMVVPGVNMPIDKSIHHIQNIYNYVAKSFSSKSGGSTKCVNESGALCPSLDNPTHALDVLQEAVNAQDLTIGEDIYLALNVAANEFFDMEKGKYEVIHGAFKNGDDMVEFWADLISKYPSILAIIDPIRSEDSVTWMKLCERVSEVVYIVGDHIYSRPGTMNDSDKPNPVMTSGIVMYQEKLNSVTDLLTCASTFQDLNNELIFSTNQGDTTDTFIVDLAVGLNARFFKLGGPCRGERSCKINRLLKIYTELKTPECEKPQTDAPDHGAIKPEVDGNLESLKEEEEEEIEDVIKDEPSHTPPPTKTGENEESVLIKHIPFSFPFIQNPQPPVKEEEDESEEVSESTKSYK